MKNSFAVSKMTTVKANMILFLLVFGMVVIEIQGGSPCPKRKDISPCVCLNSGIRTRQDTSVICSKFNLIEELTAVIPALERMSIDHLVIYDSFFPTKDYSVYYFDLNFHFLSRIKEVDMVDTMIPRTAFCKALDCSSTLTRLSLYNTSFGTDNFSFCRSADNNTITGIGCLKSLVQLDVIHGALLTDLKPVYIQDELNALQVLNLTRNRIQNVDKKFFTSAIFPKLKILDLSVNMITEINQMFSQTPMLIEYLDLSDNWIKTAGIELRNLQRLKVLKLRNNRIKTLLSAGWENVPQTFHHLDLTGNRLHCDCSTHFINATFPVHTLIVGTCYDSGEYNGMKIRKAAKKLKIQCQKEKSGN